MRGEPHALPAVLPVPTEWGAMGGPPLVWALQRGEKPLVPAGNQPCFPGCIHYSDWATPDSQSHGPKLWGQVRTLDALQKIETPLCSAMGTGRRQQSLKHRMKWKWNANATTSPTYVCTMQSTGVQMQVLYTSEYPDDLHWIGGTKSVFIWHNSRASWNQRSLTTLRSDGRQATQLRPTQPPIPNSEFTVRYALLVHNLFLLLRQTSFTLRTDQGWRNSWATSMCP